jgi:protein gp37
VSDGSKIEWTSATWSWVTGCTKISDGCLNCYIQTTPPFRIEHRKFSGPDIGATTGLKLHSDRLWWPRKWRKPRNVFVNSLGDTFHEDVPRDLIAEAFAVMAICPQHTFQVLTKRHARMRHLLSDPAFVSQVADRAASMVLSGWRWPLPNVHLGISAENQKWADIRVPALLATPAAVRWISAEPLLGSINLSLWLGDGDGVSTEPGERGLRGGLAGRQSISWLVAGGESGPQARPCELAWLRQLRDQCAETGTPFFCKQLGRTLGLELAAGAKGGDWDAWPADLRVREFPRAAEAVPA